MSIVTQSCSYFKQIILDIEEGMGLRKPRVVDKKASSEVLKMRDDEGLRKCRQQE